MSTQPPSRVAARSARSSPSQGSGQGPSQGWSRRRRLTDAQFQLARQYGFASWPKLKTHVESLQEVGQLKAAIDANDLARVQALMTRNPELHRAPLGYNKNGPLTWAAECRSRAAHARAAGDRALDDRKRLGRPPGWRRAAHARRLERPSDSDDGAAGGTRRERQRAVERQLPDYLRAVRNAAGRGLAMVDRARRRSARRQCGVWRLRADADLHLLAQSAGQACLSRSVRRGRLSVSRHSSDGDPSGKTRPARSVPGREPAILGRHFSETEIYPAELGIPRGAGLHCARSKARRCCTWRSSIRSCQSPSG